MLLKAIFISLCLYEHVNGFILPNMPAVLHLRNINQYGINMHLNRREMVYKSFLIGTAPFLGEFVKSKSVEAFTLDEEKTIKLYEKLSPSVCYISTEYKSIAQKLDVDASNIPKGVGTGFIWDKEGHIITNFHVINKVDNATVTLVNKNGVEKDYVAKLTGVDPDKDIAVLKVDIDPKDGFDLVPIPLGNNNDIRIGQYAFAIGNPFGQDHTLTMGIVSGKQREMSAPTGRKIKDVIQTDASVNPGNSGGPLLDYAGKLIGMNTATMGMGVSSGVNLAISVDTIKLTVKDIIEYGMVQRAILGISYLQRSPTREEAEKSGMPYIERGIIVLDVPEYSPAYAAGLRGVRKSNNVNDKNNTSVNNRNIIGDVIVGLEKYTINTPQDLLSALDHFKPGDKIKLFVLRGEEKKGLILDVVLGSFELNTFSGLKTEKRFGSKPGIKKIPLDIPLQNMAPEHKG